MKTTSIGVSDNYTKGKGQYNKLPRNEQAIKGAVEGARQHFNKSHFFFHISSPKSDLGQFTEKNVGRKTMLNNVLKRLGKK